MRRCTFYLSLCLATLSIALLIYCVTEDPDPTVPSVLSSVHLALLYPLQSSPSTFLASLSSLLSSADPPSSLVSLCSSLPPFCPSIAHTPCGFCWDDHTARPGGHRGPALSPPCHDWTWQADLCPLHLDCASTPSCPSIVGTPCGWCEGRGGMRGGPRGPAWDSCPTGQWVFDYRQCPVTPIPQQVHLMYGAEPTVMVATWASAFNSSSFAHYVDMDAASSAAALQSAEGRVSHFTLHNEDGLQWVHRVNMTGLQPGHHYAYWVENDGARSANFSFQALPQPLSTEYPTPRFLVWGDMGRFGGAPALAAIEAEVAAARKSASPITAVLHIGDFGYDLVDYGGVNGDAFLARVEAIAAHTPYLTCPGNHEIESDSQFAHYRARFSMPNSFANDAFDMWYSLDVGLIHLVSYSTEQLWAQPQDVPRQLAWLRADLAAANAHRAEVPWIVAFGHRPMYCSNNDGDDCTTDDSLVRATFEHLFDEAGVDLVLEAHEHSYERLFPVYDTRTLQTDYTDPLGMVHVVTGTAGCNEQGGLCINAIPGPRGDWSAVRSANRLMYGYGHLQAVNATHLYWDQVMEEEGGRTLDSLWLVQRHHGNFSARREQLSAGKRASEEEGEQGVQLPLQKLHSRRTSSRAV